MGGGNDARQIFAEAIAWAFKEYVLVPVVVILCILALVWLAFGSSAALCLLAGVTTLLAAQLAGHLWRAR